jgi:hypothetical protein
MATDPRGPETFELTPQGLSHVGLVAERVASDDLRRVGVVDALALEGDRAFGDLPAVDVEEAGARRQVVLPAPFAPSSATIAPGGTVSDTPRSPTTTSL